METKKVNEPVVIKQEAEDNIRIEKRSTRTCISQIEACGWKENKVSVDDATRTEVAKAIDPKYQETEDRNNDLEAENSALLDLHHIDTEEIKELKDQYAKLLEALKNAVDHILNRAMKIDIEATIELIQQSESKSKE